MDVNLQRHAEAKDRQVENLSHAGKRKSPHPDHEYMVPALSRVRGDKRTPCLRVVGPAARCWRLRCFTVGPGPARVDVNLQRHAEARDRQVENLSHAGKQTSPHPDHEYMVPALSRVRVAGVSRPHRYS